MRLVYLIVLNLRPLKILYEPIFSSTTFIELLHEFSQNLVLYIGRCGILNRFKL